MINSREKIERQNQQLSNYEAEIKLMRQRSDSWDGERQKYQKHIDTLHDALNRARVVSNREQTHYFLIS